MAMQAGTFFSHFKQVKAFLQQHPDVAPALAAELEKVNQEFKKTFTPDAFKQALADGCEIDSNLEELITSATIVLQKERTRLGTV